MVGAWAVFLLPGVITGLKGQTALFFAGLALGGLVWFISAMRLARPNSWWARHRYGPEKTLRSQERYPQVDPGSPSAAPKLMAATFAALTVLFIVALLASTGGGPAADVGSRPRAGSSVG